MTRISMLPPEAWAPDLRATLADTAPSAIELGVSRITAHRPEIALALGQYNAALRAYRTLPERLMELVRLRIAFHNQCRSCMAIRYASAVDDGLEEGAVCSLDRPQEAANLSAAEKAAIDYGERMATNHLSIGQETYDNLRTFFTEPLYIVELGLWVSLCVGLGRVIATWDMIEDLPAAFQAVPGDTVTPWQGTPVVVSRAPATVET